ncbi:signal peptide peptidase SppA [Pseudofulvibacter geojedonensis]|uniref:Signal peptide peptidase SppA n=1 Tax=Pseudofulvibacter geojedonensis TaxID=1123758 RepID=A0ABW3I5P8_9FLAO
MNFLKRVLATIVGIFVFIGLCFVMLMIIGAIAGGGSDDKVKIKENTVLELNLDQAIPDYKPKSEEDKIFNELFGKEGHNDLFDIISAIEYASKDENIKGISIKNLNLQAGMAQTKALRDALKEFKNTGKFIVAYGDIISQKAYYLNSVADSIYLNPVGALDFKGLSSEILYYKDFQEKYGLKMEVIRHGKYKSAVEPYLAQEMSEANREQISVFLNSIWSNMKNEISESRGVSVAQLDTIADNLLTRTATKAADSKLIDKVAYVDEFNDAIKNRLGVEEDKDVETVSIYKYAKYAAGKIRSKKAKIKDKIAVIYAQGQIMYGEGDEKTIGQGSINKALKDAREDEKIKAVVLRVNSPGGSALASELIWREIERTKAVKPVIVSMGNLAASGGYYIACNADKIIAEPSTITGSIGVFGTLPNAHEFMNNIGINAESVQTNKNAITYSFFEPLSQEQHDVIKEGVVDIYNLFVKRVADGRKMTPEAVNEIAQGRVWTGSDALNIGLVDEIGGLDIALKYAAEAAELEDYKVKELPHYEKDFEKMLSGFGFVQTKESLLKEELGARNYEIMQKMKNITKMEGAQMLLPYDLNIQ